MWPSGVQQLDAASVLQHAARDSPPSEISGADRDSSNSTCLMAVRGDLVGTAVRVPVSVIGEGGKGWDGDDHHESGDQRPVRVRRASPPFPIQRRRHHRPDRRWAPTQCVLPVPQTKKRGAQLQFDNKWTINRITPNSRPFPHPETNGKIAVKVINHYGDELLTVLDLPDPGTTS